LKHYPIETLSNQLKKSDFYRTNPPLLPVPEIMPMPKNLGTIAGLQHFLLSPGFLKNPGKYCYLTRSVT
jgi:hypothetical protein